MADTDVTGRTGGIPTFGLVISPLGVRICVILPAGRRVFPDGSRTFPDGSRVFPDGSRVFPDGSRVVPDGSRVVPGWSCAIPGGFTPAPDEAGFGSAEAVGNPARADAGGIMPIPKGGGGLYT